MMLINKKNYQEIFPMDSQPLSLGEHINITPLVTKDAPTMISSTRILK